MGNVPSVTSARQTISQRKSKTKKIISSHLRKDNFIITLGCECIQVVNGGSQELRLIDLIIRSHSSVLREGWVKNMTYSYKLRRTSKHYMIRLVADILLWLYQAGWDPLTPMEMGGKKTAICFKKREMLFDSTPFISRVGTYKEQDNPCLCIETYHDSYLVFHDVPNTVLNELVATTHKHWCEGIQGVSMGVSSVICDYTTTNHDVITTGPLSSENKFIKLLGKPWNIDTDDEFEDVTAAENLEVSIIACLAKEGYTLSIAINMDTSSRLFFFIKDEEDKNEVRQLDKAVAGMGSKRSLCTYRPIIKRSKSSFFRSFDNKASLNRRVRNSLKKKIGKESRKIKGNTTIPWFRQTSTDVATDYDDDDEDNQEEK